jgi:inward rectifier potassium channel
MMGVKMAPDSPKTNPSGEIDRDLGFGNVVASESRLRLLNRDGSFNVRREGMSTFASLSVYTHLLSITWPHFLALVVLVYLGVNALFAFGYYALGPQAIQGSLTSSGDSELLRAFFFSVQTFATIGYGHISPSGIGANLLVTTESLVGLLGFALATGLLFARFSRPTAKILFSDRAVMAPYRNVSAFEFRIVNARKSQLIEVGINVTLSRFRDGDRRVREFFPLRLERESVVFFPLAWTIVHPIDQNSPLHGLTPQDLVRSDTEFLVLVKGYDETFAQMVHARSSYKGEEIVWGARFASLFVAPDGGMVRIDIERLHDFEPAALPPPIAERAPVSALGLPP